MKENIRFAFGQNYYSTMKLDIAKKIIEFRQYTYITHAQTEPRERQTRYSIILHRHDKSLILSSLTCHPASYRGQCQHLASLSTDDNVYWTQPSMFNRRDEEQMQLVVGLCTLTNTLELDFNRWERISPFICKQEQSEGFLGIRFTEQKDKHRDWIQSAPVVGEGLIFFSDYSCRTKAKLFKATDRFVRKFIVCSTHVVFSECLVIIDKRRFSFRTAEKKKEKKQGHCSNIERALLSKMILSCNGNCLD